jgi:hypothetical protein
MAKKNKKGNNAKKVAPQQNVAASVEQVRQRGEALANSRFRHQVRQKLTPTLYRKHP